MRSAKSWSFGWPSVSMNSMSVFDFLNIRCENVRSLSMFISWNMSICRVARTCVVSFARSQVAGKAVGTYSPMQEDIRSTPKDFQYSGYCNSPNQSPYSYDERYCKPSMSLLILPLRLAALLTGDHHRRQAVIVHPHCGSIPRWRLSICTSKSRIRFLSPRISSKE